MVRGYDMEEDPAKEEAVRYFGATRFRRYEVVSSLASAQKFTTALNTAALCFFPPRLSNYHPKGKG